MKSCYEKAQEQKRELVKLGLIKEFKYVLSYGGGINSSALFFYLLENNYELDLVIYADTKQDEKDNYVSIHNMKKLCKDKDIPFVIVSKGDLYEHYYSKKAVPSIMRRDCTGKFKIAEIHRYLRLTFGKKTHFLMYIGHAYDERHRVKPSKVKYSTLLYPFVDNKIVRRQHQEIIDEHNFFAVKSGCKGCPHKKKKDFVDMFINNRAEFDKWRKLEENNSAYPRVTLTGSYTLKSLADNWNNQTFLNNIKDKETTCESGYCFL